jgi:hypothetical protein
LVGKNQYFPFCAVYVSGIHKRLFAGPTDTIISEAWHWCSKWRLSSCNIEVFRKHLTVVSS